MSDILIVCITIVMLSMLVLMYKVMIHSSSSKEISDVKSLMEEGQLLMMKVPVGSKVKKIDFWDDENLNEIQNLWNNHVMGLDNDGPNPYDLIVEQLKKDIARTDLPSRETFSAEEVADIIMKRLSKFNEPRQKEVVVLSEEKTNDKERVSVSVIDDSPFNEEGAEEMQMITKKEGRNFETSHETERRLRFVILEKLHELFSFHPGFANAVYKHLDVPQEDTEELFAESIFSRQNYEDEYQETEREIENLTFLQLYDFVLRKMEEELSNLDDNGEKREERAF